MDAWIVYEVCEAYQMINGNKHACLNDDFKNVHKGVVEGPHSEEVDEHHVALEEEAENLENWPRTQVEDAQDEDQQP